MKRLARQRAGYTLVELGISLVMLVLMAGSLSQAARSIRRMTSVGSVQEEVQAQAQKALRSIVLDLKRSGVVSVGGFAYPYLFDNGVAANGFEAHSHVAPTKKAKVGDFDYGINREIVFVQPADANSNGIPDVDGNGQVVWGATEFSYVVITGADGINYLERRTGALNPTRIASYVERVAFDSNVTSGFTVPLSAIRVRIYFRWPDDDGTSYRYSAETIVKLRNG